MRDVDREICCAGWRCLDLVFLNSMRFQFPHHRRVNDSFFLESSEWFLDFVFLKSENSVSSPSSEGALGLTVFYLGHHLWQCLACRSGQLLYRFSTEVIEFCH